MKNSLIILCYNELQNLKSLEKKIKFVSKKIDGEIIIVDNGSKDGSFKYLTEKYGSRKKIKIVRLNKNQGYGGGILAGISNSRSEIVGWTHGDGQFDLIDVLLAFNLINKQKNPKNYFIKGKRKNRSLSETFLTIIMGLVSTILFIENLFDCNGQPTIFHKNLINYWRDPPKNFMLDFYVFMSAKISKLKIIRYDVIVYKRLKGTSKWNTGLYSIIKISCSYLLYFFQLKLNIQTKYKCVKN
jgi:glycosyltransferase involved in cell wall biosynthesis